MYTTLALVGMKRDEIEHKGSGGQPTYEQDGTWDRSSLHNDMKVISKVPNRFVIYQLTESKRFLLMAEPSDVNPKYKKGLVRTFRLWENAYTSAIDFLFGEDVPIQRNWIFNNG